MLPGVYQAKKKNGMIYYRSNITFQGKHISLGSFETETDAHECYLEALKCIDQSDLRLEEAFQTFHYLSYDKIVILINFRDHKMYIKTPIYLSANYFSYYLASDFVLKFDIDDLFYYSQHRIIRRGNHLYVNDYGMQVSILTRFGIHSFSVPGRDYVFSNGDNTDFRYSNIHVINKYIGVYLEEKKGKPAYVTRIHINGNFLVGTYDSEIDAAIAYNKAIDVIHKAGVHKDFITNYIVEISSAEYARRYDSIHLSKKLINYLKKFTLI